MTTHYPNDYCVRYWIDGEPGAIKGVFETESEAQLAAKELNDQERIDASEWDCTPSGTYQVSPLK